MKIVKNFPRAVREIEHVMIPLRDGTRLAARIYLPDDADQHPVPVLLEYIPYRKRDVTAIRDSLVHPYYAGHGYASVRVDLRGAGDSEGILENEYLRQEQDDALDVLAWLADQPWSTGVAGMFGISWGGFNALQVAARRPPSLKAIVTVASTDDRYADDIHYMGGCLIEENLGWSSVMFSHNARPPDPDLVGDGWREMWMRRLEANEPWILTWLRHQRRDDYWKHGSVCEDYGAIECAVYAMGGWADGYSNAIPRLLAGLDCPRKGLIGPWSHNYPHTGKPGPQGGYLQESLRWWDYWLKGEDTGVMDEPTYRVWMQDPAPPRRHYIERPGRWVAEPQWPSPDSEIRSYKLDEHRLGDRARDHVVAFRSPLTMGSTAGEWCPHGDPGELPGDQRPDDGCSETFETAALTEPVEILGAPRLRLRLSADRPNAFVVARLCDVAPDGASTLVTYGVLNLTHRNSHETPAALEPGDWYDVTVTLNDIAQRFERGHRMRLSLSNAYWPLIWPSPEAVTLSIDLSASRFDLPVRAPKDSDKQPAPFPASEAAEPLTHTTLEPDSMSWQVERDAIAGGVTVRRLVDKGFVHLDDINWSFGSTMAMTMSVRDDDPLSAQTVITKTTRFQRNGLRLRTETRTIMTATENAFHIRASLDAYEGDSRVCTKSWSETVPRDLV